MKIVTKKNSMQMLKNVRKSLPFTFKGKTYIKTDKTVSKDTNKKINCVNPFTGSFHYVNETERVFVHREAELNLNM